MIKVKMRTEDDDGKVKVSYAVYKVLDSETEFHLFTIDSEHVHDLIKQLQRYV